MRTDAHRSESSGGHRSGSAGSHHEVRGSGRVGSDLPVEIHLSDLPAPLPARSRDIGVGGICIATPTVFALKSVRRAVIGLPSGPLALDAEGVWQFDASADDVVLSGLAFLDPPAESIETLSNLVLESGRALARFLYAHSDLKDFGLEEVLGLAQITRFRDVPAGRSVFRQDTTHQGEDSIFIVARGGVALEAHPRRGREVVLARLGPGRLFGGLPLLGPLTHAESAVAESDTRLLEIDRDAFRYLENARPWLAQRLALAVIRAHAARLHEMLARVRGAL